MSSLLDTTGRTYAFYKIDKTEEQIPKKKRIGREKEKEKGKEKLACPPAGDVADT